MRRQDKEMRGRGKVTMHKRLINSFFTFFRLGDFHLASPEGERRDIPTQETECARENITQLWDICFSNGALMYLKRGREKKNHLSSKQDFYANLGGALRSHCEPT